MGPAIISSAPAHTRGCHLRHKHGAQGQWREVMVSSPEAKSSPSFPCGGESHRAHPQPRHRGGNTDRRSALLPGWIWWPRSYFVGEHAVMKQDGKCQCIGKNEFLAFPSPVGLYSHNFLVLQPFNKVLESWKHRKTSLNAICWIGRQSSHKTRHNAICYVLATSEAYKT